MHVQPYAGVSSLLPTLAGIPSQATANFTRPDDPSNRILSTPPPPLLPSLVPSQPHRQTREEKKEHPSIVQSQSAHLASARVWTAGDGHVVPANRAAMQTRWQDAYLLCIVTHREA